MNPALVRARLKKGEEVLRDLRPVTLTWGDGDPRTSVEAREGQVSEENALDDTGYDRVREVKFYVLRELLPVPPKIGTKLDVQGRSEKWKVRSMPAGRSVNDVTWILHCEEVNG